jgi:hypothetical protein
MGSGPVTSEQVSVLGYFSGVSITLVLSVIVAMRSGPYGARPTDTAPTREVFDANAAEFHVLFAGFTAVFLSLIAMVLLTTIKGHDDVVWRFIIAINGLLHVNGSYRLLGHHLAARWFSKQRVAMLAIGCTNAAVSFLVVAGFLGEAQPLVLFLGILWAIAATALAFLSWLKSRQPIGSLTGGPRCP